jgi:hypothetical protein
MKKSFVLFVSNSPDGGRRLSTCTRCPLLTCSASHASAEPRLSHQQHEDLLSYRSKIRTPGPLQPTIEHIQTTERPGGGASRICERENTVRDDTLSIGRGRRLRERFASRGSGTLAHDRDAFYEIYRSCGMKRHGTVWARASFSLLVLTTLSNKTLLKTPKSLACSQTL